MSSRAKKFLTAASHLPAVLNPSGQRIWLAAGLACGLGGSIAAWLIGIRSLKATLPYFLQTAFLVLLLLAAVSFNPMLRRYLLDLTAKQRSAIIAMVVTLLFVQGVGVYRATFPVLPWSMYAGKRGLPAETIFVAEVYGVREDGSEERLNPARLFPTNGRGYRRMENKFHNLTQNVALRQKAGSTASPSKKAEAQAALTDIVRSIALAHNDRYRSAPVGTIRIYARNIHWRKNIQESRFLVQETQISAER